MQFNVNIPTSFQTPFASEATQGVTIRALPNVTSNPNVASQTQGFPYNTSLPVAGGGTPPNIQDMNSVLNNGSAWDQWYQAGGAIQWNAPFSSNVGGYAGNCVVMSVSNPGTHWLSTADKNTTNPDTGGANWLQLPIHGQAGYWNTGTYTFVGPFGVPQIYVELWGGGGGSAGYDGASGAGGGYCAGWRKNTPGLNYQVIVGGAGGGSYPAGSGGGTSFFTDGTTVWQATGGSGGGGGPGPGGIGSGSGAVSQLQGQCGTDLTESTGFSIGGVGNAIGGNAAGGGGLGGIINAAGAGLAPTVPGGGGGSNSAAMGCLQNGAQGGCRITW